MSEVSVKSYNIKLHYNVLDLDNFFDKLENAIINHKSMDTIKLPINSYLKYTKAEYDKQFEENELKRVYEKRKRIIKHLETNKYKIAKKRKIEIFKTWMYWLSAANYKAFSSKLFILYDVIYREIFSLENLHETAMSILYEVENFNCCYDYYNSEFDLNADKMRNRLKHRRAKVVDYKLGDIVSVKIPRIDRGSLDVSRLPAKILNVKKIAKKSSMFELLTDWACWTRCAEAS